MVDVTLCLIQDDLQQGRFPSTSFSTKSVALILFPACIGTYICREATISTERGLPANAEESHQEATFRYLTETLEENFQRTAGDRKVPAR